MFIFKDLKPCNTVKTILTLVNPSDQTASIKISTSSIVEVNSDLDGSYINMEEPGILVKTTIKPIKLSAVLEPKSYAALPIDFSMIQYINGEKRPAFKSGQLLILNHDALNNIVEMFMLDHVACEAYHITNTSIRI